MSPKKKAQPRAKKSKKAPIRKRRTVHDLMRKRLPASEAGETSPAKLFLAECKASLTAITDFQFHVPNCIQKMRIGIFPRLRLTEITIQNPADGSTMCLYQGESIGRAAAILYGMTGDARWLGFILITGLPRGNSVTL